MEKNVSSALQRFAAAFDQFFPALAKDLDSDVRWNASLLDEAAAEVELDLGSGRESDFDLFKTDLHQHIEEAEFFIDIHRLGQGLIAVPEVDTAPHWGSIDHSVGPFSIREKDWLKRTILCQGRGLHKRDCSRKL
jgi:hypothetical protein